VEQKNSTISYTSYLLGGEMITVTVGIFTFLFMVMSVSPLIAKDEPDSGVIEQA
jgi:hypothetical protein